jgi:hypothetical protein
VGEDGENSGTSLTGPGGEDDDYQM